MQYRISRLWLPAIVVSVAITLIPSLSSAQETGRVRGVVTDAGTGAPIADAQVTVVGTDRGAVSDIQGRFLINDVPAGSRELRARKIGFAAAVRDVTVTAAQEARADIALRIAPTQLSEVVVTGTPLAQQRRELGNAVTTLDVAELTEKSTLQNVADVLQSKTPGVTVMPGSGAPGTAGEIRIRGTASLSGYKPVVYIDGIRYNSEHLGNFSPTGSGLAGQSAVGQPNTGFSQQSTSALDLISPNDIESIEVIKGPAAATLYGADAAGGVIQIITKKGLRGQQRVRWTAKLERGTSEWALDTPLNYTTCDSVKQAPANAATWPGCQGVPQNTILTDVPMERDPDALRSATLQRMNLSARGGGDRYSFFVSGLQDKDEGVYINNFNNRKSARANFTVAATNRMDFDLVSSYTTSNFRLPYQDESANALLLSAARGKPGRIPIGSATGPHDTGWATILPRQSNRYHNETTSERITLGGTFNYRPLAWFRNRFTAGLDYTSTLAELVAPPGSVEAATGFSAQRTPRTHIYSLDYAGSIERPLGLIAGLLSTTSFGTQIVSRRDELLSATGTGLGAQDVTLIGTAATTSGLNTFSENNSVGYYVQQMFGWQNRLYLTGAVRADDNSSFGTDFDIIVYPKLSLSWVLSEEPMMARILDPLGTEEFRFRTAWGRAGRAPAPYSATQTYTVGSVVLGGATQSALRTLAFGNPGLKPEKGEEIEIGFDASFLQRRLGLDVTYYNKTMRDMLSTVALPAATGFAVSGTASAVVFANLGEVNNRGWEAAINGTPLSWRNFAWDTRLNLATNRNRLNSFGVLGKTLESPPGQAYGAVQQHRPGSPLGAYWVQLPLRDASGRPVYTGTLSLASPNVSITLDTARTFIGPSTPTREIGFSNTITFFRNFRLYALLDHKGGHHIFNLKEFNRCQTANDNCALVNDPTNRFALANGDTARHLEMLVRRQVHGVWVEKADFTKLRDLSLSWTVPNALLTRTGASAATLTLSGHNLALWSDYTGFDPEVNTYGTRNFVRVDAYASPMMRRWTLGLNLNF
jgi:TonB-linked SusC/RagA family outer membrane protein